MKTESLHYAGFWMRLGALFMDSIICAPWVVLMYWGVCSYRLFLLYIFLPNILFGLFYSVYLVKRYGGTPGKLLTGIRIRKLDGRPVGYREAILRDYPIYAFGLLMSGAGVIAVLHMTEAEYQSLSFVEFAKRIAELAPWWHRPLKIAQNLWVLTELIVLLVNRKKRALHDFIAGTVVVHVSPVVAPKPMAAIPVS